MHRKIDDFKENAARAYLRNEGRLIKIKAAQLLRPKEGREKAEKGRGKRPKTLLKFSSLKILPARHLKLETPATLSVQFCH